MPEEVALSSLPPSALQPETKEGLPSLLPSFQVGRILQTYPSADENRSGGNGSIHVKAHRREESRRPRETPLQSPVGMSDRSEGEIISFSVPSMIGGGCPLLYEDGLNRRAPAASEEMVHGFSASPGAPPAGTFWNEDSSTSCLATDTANRAKSGVGGGSSRQTTVSYVINEASPGLLQAAESGALQSLKEASEAVGADLQTLHFGKLDFGETSVLDRFYNAGESLVSHGVWDLMVCADGPVAISSFRRKGSLGNRLCQVAHRRLGDRIAQGQMLFSLGSSKCFQRMSRLSIGHYSESLHNNVIEGLERLQKVSLNILSQFLFLTQKCKKVRGNRPWFAAAYLFNSSQSNTCI